MWADRGYTRPGLEPPTANAIHPQTASTETVTEPVPEAPGQGWPSYETGDTHLHSASQETVTGDHRDLSIEQVPEAFIEDVTSAVDQANTDQASHDDAAPLMIPPSKEKP